MKKERGEGSTGWVLHCTHDEAEKEIVLSGQLREDAGLAEMLGHAVPSAEAARKCIYQFHEEAKIEQSLQELARGVS